MTSHGTVTEPIAIYGHGYYFLLKYGEKSVSTVECF